MRYYLDTEFNGAGGELISLALVREDGRGFYAVLSEAATEPWVQDNVLPVLWSLPEHSGPLSILQDSKGEVAFEIARFMDGDAAPVIVADWLADISHLCTTLTARSLYWSDPSGDLQHMPALRFEVSNVDAYPTTLKGAVQHNAWWDAMALRAKLQSSEAQLASQDGKGPVRALSATDELNTSLQPQRGE